MNGKWVGEMSNVLYIALAAAYFGVLVAVRPGVLAAGKCLIPLGYALGAGVAVALLGYLVVVLGPGRP